MRKITDQEERENEYLRFIAPLKINPVKLKSLEESRDPNKKSDKEKILELMEYGLCYVNEENKVVSVVFEPVEYGESKVSELIFRGETPNVSDIEKFGVGRSDMEKTRRIFSFLVNGKFPSSIFSKMKSDDLNNFAQIAAFFLPQSD